MSFRVTAWAASVKTGSPVRKLILFALADRANDQGVCWPSTELIASDCELTRETVSRNLKSMSEAGLLRIAKRKGKGQQFMNNVYYLAIPCDAESHGHVTQNHTPCDAESHGHVTESHTNLSSSNLSIEPNISMGASHSKAEENPSRPAKTPTAGGTAREARFARPNEDDVKAYMMERVSAAGLAVCQVQAAKFVAHHEANGWMRGKTKMRDWKAAVRTWVLNDFDKVFTKSPTSGGIQL